MLLIGLSAGAVFGFNPSARVWVLESLGYGLIPTGLWLGAALVTLRYHRRSLARYWRRWSTAAALVAISIGVLSQFYPYDGIFSDASLGGYWGIALGGAPLSLAILKLVATCCFVPLSLYPRRVGAFYLVVVQRFALSLQYGVTYLYLGAYYLVRFLGDGLKLVFNDRSRRQLRDGVRGTLSWASSAIPRRRPAAADPGYPDIGYMAPSDVPSEWPDTQHGFDADLEPEEKSTDHLPQPKVTPVRVAGSKWSLPAIDCLSPPVPHEQSEASLEEMARHVESTLAEHGVAVEVKDIRSGPRIVRFGLVPGWTNKRGEATKGNGGEGKGESNRVKVQSILTREKDLALALKTPYLRIEAPVPGEALVGLEVPVPTATKVHLREVIESQAFRNVYSKGGLPVALGQDTGGNPVVLDLAALPHLLIAGATGSGKSVCINSIVASLLLTKPPDQFRILMVDPKRVELTPFNGIPQLIGQVIVEVDEVNSALRG
ncbi:MAG: DUF87 domain-containing protein, partial [Chloroflexi bacterium]|nr:DUF87 domain-containing protein [Chloroflexota bacterium]